ncbi:hypothetical protein NY2A_b140L [Paramecium bursaria Chlorella virus NY2A]|uniref:Uncharacterized protein b140L n=1 Tax=Paramecium bursaria Chlorella virus NY2A TaxID=46021 RepID=A7IW15_PBCVN|nr:hypothetical protein NY2A_b140L [Paramecium bursaria Chlorella virus NY2A]YP_001498211.1 hypothetical protein AR158_c129L [Paramecium bursaria Chlorella virus AR158]ABT14539.1 hypothetical protein NY2A_b140L [Paramecium bursaria Chlorella virus NY2A]ABU43675.1 hypothetical protein AR158_c129L [Paramecium bursaria Chlorella virus AR158]
MSKEIPSSKISRAAAAASKSPSQITTIVLLSSISFCSLTELRVFSNSVLSSRYAGTKVKNFFVLS